MSTGQAAPVASNLLLGKGKIYFNRIVGGVGVGLRFMGNCSSLEISTEDETRSKYSSADAAAGLLKKALIRRTPKLSLTLDEFTRENVALALMGDETSYSQAATPIVAEILSTAPVAGMHYRAAKRAMTSVVVKRGATTLVLDTDYRIISAEAGLIYLISGAGSGNLTIDYTPTAITAQDMVDAAESSVIEGELQFIGDPSAGPKWDVLVWKASISPDGGFGLISDDFAEFKITAEVLQDAVNHPTQPYFRAILMP